MKSKKLACFLSLTMLVSLLAGCGSESGDSESSQNSGSASTPPSENTESSANSEEESEEPVEITWLGYYTSDVTISENTWGQKLLEDKFNVKITPVTDVSGQNIDTYVASGDILNVTCYPLYLHSDVAYMYDQGLIREIPEEWLYEYYPTGMARYEEVMGKEYFENGYHRQNGKVLYTPFNVCWNEGETVFLYRKDWLDALNLKEPATLDELHDMLYAFTYNDPDGNGVKDTYGISCVYSWRPFWPVFSIFGGEPMGFKLQEDGSVIFQGATENYKQALTIIKEWYDEGIIDPEGITDGRSEQRTKWSNGTLGAMCDNISWTMDYRGSSSVINMVEDVYGKNTVALLHPITTEYGDGKSYACNTFPYVSGNNAMVFTSSATDEQVIAVLKMLEGIASDDELNIALNYGEEGVDYDWQGDMLVVKENTTVENWAARGISSYFAAAAVSDAVITAPFTERDKERLAITTSWPEIYRSNNFPTPSSEVYNLYGPEISKVVEEYYYSVLLGTDSLDAWDAYVKRLEDAGLPAVLEEYETLLK